MTAQIDPFTTATTVNTTTTGNQTTPVIAKLGSGDYVVVWRDDGPSESPTFTIKARLYETDGTPKGGEFVVSSGSSDFAYAPSVTALPGAADNFAVSWLTSTNYFPTSTGGFELGYTGQDKFWARSYLNGVGGATKLVADKISSSTEALVNHTNIATTSDGRIALIWKTGLFQDGDLVQWAFADPMLSSITIADHWYDYTQDLQYAITGLTDKRYAVYITNHPPVLLVIDQHDQSELYYPGKVDGMTPLSDGGLVLTRREPGANGTFSASMQILSASGVLGPNITIDASSQFLSAPAVAEMANGVLAVTWSDRDDQSVHVQLFDKSGATLGSPYLLDGTNAGEEFYPDITAISGNRFAVTWYTADGSVDGSGRAVREQILKIVDDGNHTPVITGFGGDADGVVAIEEKQPASTIVATVGATDADNDDLTYSFLPGGDAAKFAIDAGGHIRFLASPVYTAPTDGNGDNIYEMLVDVSDGKGGHASTLVKVAVQDPLAEYPKFLDGYGNDAGPRGDYYIAENSYAGIPLLAKDMTPGDKVTYSLVADAPNSDTSLFTINPDTGVLSLIAPLDYENPISVRNNNYYFVTVRATDLAGHTDQLRMQIQVVDEPVGQTSITVGTPSVTEGNVGDAPVLIPVTFHRTGSGDAYDIYYSLTSGSATYGIDFGSPGGSATGTLHFDNNVVETTIFIPILPDNVPEGNETFTISITGTSQYSAITGGARKTITIVNDDVPHPGVTKTALPGGGTLSGTANDDTLIGLGGNDTLLGGDGEDHLIGGAGSDHLGGGEGADVMEGGTGDDFYFVSDAFDTVIERVGGGIDQVTTTVDYTLGSQVENLALAASGLTVHGNFLANTIWGSSGTDIIHAEMGSDTVKAAGGDDIVYGGTGHDVLSGEDGNDVLYGERNDDTLYGGAGDDQLYGGDGSDHLGGGAGADYLAGGAGDDFYFMTDSFDTIFEAANEGRDLVTSTIGYTLGDNLEDLVLEGTGGLVGTGNALDNLIIGGSGNNILYGMDGNDTLYGRGGGDTLYGGAGADRFKYQSVIDSPNGNADRIKDFSATDGDVIDFSYMDADSRTAVDDSFTWLGTGAFTGAGAQLRMNSVGGDSHIEGDVNGDGIADFTIVVEGVSSLSAANFML